MFRSIKIFIPLVFMCQSSVFITVLVQPTTQSIGYAQIKNHISCFGFKHQYYWYKKKLLSFFKLFHVKFPIIYNNNSWMNGQVCSYMHVQVNYLSITGIQACLWLQEYHILGLWHGWLPTVCTLDTWSNSSSKIKGMP